MHGLLCIGKNSEAKNSEAQLIFHHGFNKWDVHTSYHKAERSHKKGII